MIFWAVHYIPFFLMNRQLFIHHYLPSHLASALIAGAALSFICSDTVNYPISIAGRNTRRQPRTYADLGTKGVIIVGAFMVAMLMMYVYMAPLTYGSPG
jgi:dolichyl-phosphate-mannose-protein mannosyltransferase